MKKRILFILFLSFFYLNNVSANNLAYLDLNYLLNNSLSGKNLIKNLEVLNNQNIEKLKKEQVTLNNERDNINKIKNIISSEELNNKISVLNEKLNKFQQKQDKMSKEFKQKQEEEIKNFFNKINPIIEKYMLDNNIDLILKKENIFISKKNFDITNIIIELINKKFTD